MKFRVFIDFAKVISHDMLWWSPDLNPETSDSKATAFSSTPPASQTQTAYSVHCYSLPFVSTSYLMSPGELSYSQKLWHILY